MGQAVLPGVWALEHLARAVEQMFPGVAPTACTAVRFEKFLELPSSDIPSIDAFVELARISSGEIEAALLTRHVAVKSGIARMKTHARACFGPGDQAGEDLPTASTVGADAFCVSPERLYAEMVPFGTAFQNIVSPVRLDTGGAHAMVSGGDPGTEDTPLRLGSPFALDAAFHAACAWGQRYYGVVAFPVALQQRRVRQRTRCGRPYGADVRFRGDVGDALLFDLCLRDREGRICEVIQGLVMRDVSGGKLQPPDWICSNTGADDPS